VLCWTREQQRVQALARCTGCTFESKRSGSGHLIVRRGKRKSELPVHGGRKELGVGLINEIKRDLGLK
jgi:mRNA interferase HicA